MVGTKKGFGEFIKQQRLASGYKSQRKFARKTGISPATISRIEAEIQLPEITTLLTMSNFLTSTSYRDLMIVCGYGTVGEVENADGIRNLDLTSLEEPTVNLMVDGETLTDTEIKGMIAFVRSYRGLI